MNRRQFIAQTIILPVFLLIISILYFTFLKKLEIGEAFERGAETALLLSISSNIARAMTLKSDLANEKP